VAGRGRRHDAAERKLILSLLDEAVAAGARQAKACECLGLPSRTIQRWRAQGGGDDQRKGSRSVPANKLDNKERQNVLEVANSPEFRELSPKQIVPTLADLGIYIASESTFYRVLRQENLNCHREPTRPPVSKPRAHRATGPNQVWSWDITYLRSAMRGTFYYLYMVVDIWSRKIVGWSVHDAESKQYAAELIARICDELDLDPDGLVLHSDNGSPMKGSTMLATLQRLGIVPSFSRPRVSDDNPFSESLFRTLKYRPHYPRKPFESLNTARLWVDGFVLWYNAEHRHSAIRFVTPDERHYGHDKETLERRRHVYEDARRRNPIRWTGGIRNWTPVGDVLLNPDNDDRTTSAGVVQ